MERHPDNFGIAQDAARKGIIAIPILPGTKTPAVKWKEWQTKVPPIDLQREWFRKKCNIAILTTGMVVFDCETAEKARLVLKNFGETPHMLKTPGGGMHLGYRKRKGVPVENKVKIKGLPIDIRTDGGLELIPDSETAKGRYEWLGPGLQAIADLPVAKVGWTRERVRKVVTRVSFEHDPDVRKKRAWAYIMKIYSIAGQRGHASCFRAVCRCRDFGLSAEETLALMSLWNEINAIPMWSHAELLHKVDSVFKLRK